MTAIRLNKNGTPDKRYGKKNRIPSEREGDLNDDMAALTPPPVEEIPVENYGKSQAEIETETPKQETTLTSEEKALADRLTSKADSAWETITEESMIDYSLSNDPYPLPKEAKKLQKEKKYAFKWFLADKRRVDEVRHLEVPERWEPCNRNNTPFLAKHCDTIHGGIQHKDQILMYKPYWMHRKFKDSQLGHAEVKGMAGAIENKDGEQHDWGGYESGPQHKITGKDQVFDSDTGSFSGEAA